MFSRSSRLQSSSASSGREETPPVMRDRGTRSESPSAMSGREESPPVTFGRGSKSGWPSALSGREEPPPVIFGRGSDSGSSSAFSGRGESPPAIFLAPAMFDRGSGWRSSSASIRREESPPGRSASPRSSPASCGGEESPPDHHAVRFTISLPRTADETSERRQRHDDQGLNLCFHGDWFPTRGTLELHFSSEGIHASFAGQQPPQHEDDARVLTLECNRITFPTPSSSSSSTFRSLVTWLFVGVGLYFAAKTLVMISVETHIYLDRSALRSMEHRWREIPLSAELGRVALLYGAAASSLVDLNKAAASLLSSLRETMLPLCRQGDMLTHSIEVVCDEYDAVLTEAFGTVAAVNIQASSLNVAGAINGSRVEGLLSCWNEIDREYTDDDDDDADEYATGAVFSCVAELLRRWDTDDVRLLSPAAEEAGKIEGQLREMGARQDWIVDPFEELLRQEALRSASSGATTARAGAKKKVVPQSVSAAVSAMRNAVGAEFDGLMGRIVLWREAMVSAGAERALLDARLSVVAGAEWVTRPWGLALLWKFPAMDRMVSDDCVRHPTERLSDGEVVWRRLSGRQPQQICFSVETTCYFRVSVLHHSKDTGGVLPRSSISASCSC